jgi:hypothetical protein
VAGIGPGRLEQPVPDVAPADVERILRRDFPEKLRTEARALLDRCSADAMPPSPRVQLAVLKLADGNLKKLGRFVETARMDYRDVLAWAEYPGYMQRVPGPGQPPESDRIIAADWQQYQDWLSR